MTKEYTDEYICPVCKTKFFCPFKDMWVYKKTYYNKEYVFCSWGCMQKKRAEVEKERANKPERRGKKKVRYEM